MTQYTQQQHQHHSDKHKLDSCCCRSRSMPEHQPPEGASSLMDLFAPPPQDSASSPKPETDAGKSQSRNGRVAKAEPAKAVKNDEFSVDHFSQIAQATKTARKEDFSVEQFGQMARDEIPEEEHNGDRRSTAVASNKSDRGLPSPRPAALLQDSFLESLFDNPTPKSKDKHSDDKADADADADELTPLVQGSPLGGLFNSPKTTSQDITPKIGAKGRKTMSLSQHMKGISNLPPIHEIPLNDSLPVSETCMRKLRTKARSFLAEGLTPTSLIGSCMFLLYHTVFCLAMGSAITRLHGQVPILGLMIKMASLGIIFGAPVYWLNIGSIPALYPTVDLFSAPFLADIAAIVDETLFNDPDVSEEDNVQMFLGSFTLLASLAIFISGFLLVLASVFKLANLGAYLPFPVLSGFFAAVGVLTWTLAFKVDTNGISFGTVFFSGDGELMYKSFIHHLPSVLIAATMKYLGPKSPFYVIGLVFGSVSVFYVIMFVFGISMEEAVERKWFWSSADLEYVSADSNIGWYPPAPFGLVNSWLQGKIHWGAVMNGTQTTIALSFLYLIRCSLHGAALKKNVPNLSRTEKTRPVQGKARFSVPVPHRRKFSEVLDIESMPPTVTNAETTIVRPKPTSLSLKTILIQYGYSQFICGAVGGFPITPSVAASPTMYMLGAEGIVPQLGSVLLLLCFYLTDFKLVGYIPKPAFSSLLVLAFIDMISTWFIQSYFKTKEKMEWLVVPLIVVLASVVGLLGAVFLGIAMSTFLFVAAFFRSGVVKYIANGITIRSTIERSLKTGKWLDEHGDRIQLIVLQNFLFFGNASSILSYISSMFEEPASDVDSIFVPPVPKIVVLDMTLVTGMDTSAVDVINDILVILSNHDAKLFLSGVSTNLRQVMLFGGVKPESTRNRSKRKLRFFPDLDSSIGKAEDMLLEHEAIEDDIIHYVGGVDSGFKRALRHIDEQHDTKYLADLLALQEHTKAIEVEPGDVLYDDHHDMDRGLFFVESGVMKIERNSNFTLSRVGNNEANRRMSMNNGSLNQLKARTGSIGREMARLKAGGDDKTNQSFRLARIGPGWVLGSIEAVSGLQHPGSLIAVTPCCLHYISYKKIDEIEEYNPRLVLKLHKLLSYLMAKRQEVTIGQLATLHSIMSSPAHKKPVGRGDSTHLSHISSFYN